ncbi:glucose-1-phosphate adenylyltransferase subunit GlgD [uncultured Anaerococcus sp.]|uniref:glucose-1-phosphate adenylyltransferase subunit GlgD n=1 Tax=uncultured Anaerococcus sp. TaxID=293428 RepID=UPI00288C1F71|nr:glucose-1-phosphate adenylyltransferase subunit GlgD [uncultured Anaerococcus sp.]
MDRVVALVYSPDFKETNYGPLCKVRPDYMLPFGGRYRIIDFALSNLANYDINRVILYAGGKLRSALDHVGNGKSWELNRRNGGLMINPIGLDGKGSKSEIETYYDTIVYFQEHDFEYVYVKNPMYIVKEDISDAIEKLKEENLDCLILSNKVVDKDGEYLNQSIINSDEDGKPSGVGLNLGITDTVDLFLGSLLMKKESFLSVLRHAMQENVYNSLLSAIFAYPGNINIDFYRQDKEFEIIKDFNSFYEVNMRLLNQETFDKLFYEDGLVYTKSKDEPSTSYTKNANVKNSLIANGGIIEGEVENSIIFRGAKIGKGAIIRNSIIFQDSVIGDGAILNFVITDKGTEIGHDVRLFGNRANPYVTSKNESLDQRSY